jgi:hypothetical protein
MYLALLCRRTEQTRVAHFSGRLEDQAAAEQSGFDTLCCRCNPSDAAATATILAGLRHLFVVLHTRDGVCGAKRKSPADSVVDGAGDPIGPNTRIRGEG